MTLKVRFYNPFHSPSFWSERSVEYNLLQRNIQFCKHTQLETERDGESQSVYLPNKK